MQLGYREKYHVKVAIPGAEKTGTGLGNRSQMTQFHAERNLKYIDHWESKIKRSPK